MTLRTPRRRISPRAKRRCRAIRDFFRRALGTSSQKDIKINSSIAVNVTDLKHKIVGLERQLEEVHRNCEDLAYIENTLRKEADQILEPESTCQHDIICLADSTVDLSNKKSMISSAKTSDRPLEPLRRKSDESEYVSKEYRSTKERKHKTLPATLAQEQRYLISKHRHRKNTDEGLHVDEQKFEKRRTRSTLEAFGDATSYADTSYQALAPPPLTEYPPPTPRLFRDLERKHYKDTENLFDQNPERRHKYHSRRKKSVSPQRYDKDIDLYQENAISHLREDRHRRNRKNKKERSNIDSDFITDIIQKQYKPINMFGRRGSEMSQISAPVCRDQEFSLRENIQEGADLCSCCHEREAYRTNHHRSAYHSSHRSPYQTLPSNHHNYYDTGSVCDARLYRTKRIRVPRRRYRYVDIYNDETLYDVVPVKEKSSPKSRRKFVESNIIDYEYYREVPPSPRTQRPQLNLKAQHDDYEEYMMTKHAKTSHLERHKRRNEYPNAFLEAELNEISNEQHNDSAPVSGSQRRSFENNINKTPDAEKSEKDVKALDEIKNILQRFLQEIKRDPTPQDKAGQDQNIQTTNASGATDAIGVPGNIGVTPIAAQVLPTVPSYTVAQCSIPNQCNPFANPCCCPMPPIFPLSYVPTGCPARSASCTCHLFPPKHENRCQECSQKTGTLDTDNNRDTDELIKEIYKLVTLNPHSARKRNPDQKKESNGKEMTSRSVGDSYSRVSRRDVKVATSALKCYSKSCEAIGSRMITETYTSYTTRSDTAIEKLNLDISQSDTEITTAINVREKAKQRNKLTDIFKGLFKKKRTDTESSFEVDIVPKEPPFRQEIYNYAMHEQEFYNKPPYRPGYDPYCYVSPPPGCEHRGPYYHPGPTAPSGNHTPHHLHEQTIPEHPPHYHHSHTHPPVPPYHEPYEPYCNHHAPQIPLCLKEIEVKSTGTQSERKMSFFRKLGRKTPPDESREFRPQPRFTEGTQTFEERRRSQKLATESSKPLFPGWKKFQEKVQKDLEQDPMMYNYKMKKKLQDGDRKLKSTMIKKMFHKKNPFSPNNLIIRTLLGNDPSSFGEPNVTLKPRLFF